LASHGVPADSAEILTEHLIDAHCTGLTYAGLPRLLVLLDRLADIPPDDLGQTDVVHETPSSAWIDGRGNLGYITCQRAIQIGITKAESEPVVLVGAFNSHYSGRLGYYAAQAARQGLIVVHMSNGSPMVAPPGGT